MPDTIEMHTLTYTQDTSTMSPVNETLKIMNVDIETKVLIRFGTDQVWYLKV